MRKWSDISLYQFQQIEAINETKMDDLDKLLFSTCIVFDMTEYELDHTEERKAAKLIERVSKIFSSEFNPKPHNRIGLYRVNYDVSNMTFGQYIELSFFLQQPIKHAHYVMASISKRLWRDLDHKRKADYFLERPVTNIIGCISELKNSWAAFNAEYKGLFGLDSEVYTPTVSESQFTKRYGWIYSATQVAEYERITLDAAFRLPIRQALNDLAYLKAKVKFDNEQIKKK